MNILTGYDEQIAAWVGKRIGRPDSFGPMSAIGFVQNNVLIAGCVYSNYVGHSVELTVAADKPTWCNRANLRVIFGYAFIDLGVTRMTLVISRGNKRSRRLARGMGFTQEGVIRRAYDGVHDAVVYGMLLNECKWLNKGHSNGKDKPAEIPEAA